ncbi:amidohydrolase [Alginatibacterium sediminis]|uniref:Amidohydrolase n=1 Tax=Alginatibacterium sediminis TaxID=2164068 RepID=A0A420E6P6_9ALTE|nr:amidohydrolase family protein [Alginatibacterium sediminis]RKF13730.1 amidohydrolase [Alginatibacterium sediminis]
MNYLIKNAQTIFQDSKLNSSTNANDIRISQGVITEIGTQLLPNTSQNERLINAKGCVVYPGFVNTHHHLAQSVLKGVPEGLNQDLGQWLAAVPYRFWPKIPPRLMYLSAKLGIYELIRSGATSCADHHYLYHANSSAEVEAALWQAASDMGIRFTLCRGGATQVGKHKGMSRLNLQPESIEQCLERMQDSLKHHDPSPLSMSRLCVAPTSLIHSASKHDLITLAQFARSNGLKLHSHLLEVEFDQQQALKNHQMSAIDYAHSCDWLGADVWFAHLVKADRQAIELLAQTNTGMSHCPTSNCRLGSGIAPAYAMDKAGINVSIGVDGSASSESGSMLQELNLAWLLQRAQHGAANVPLEQVVHWGTRNGAHSLGLKTGRLELGYAADLVIYDIEELRIASVHDQRLAPILCGEPTQVKYSFINGVPVIDKGLFTRFDPQELAAELKQEMRTFLATIE